MLRLIVLLAAGLAAPHPHPRVAPSVHPAAARDAHGRPAHHDPLVVVKKYIPGVVVHLRYATRDNFMHKRVYPKDARCLLRRSVVRALKRAEQHLERAGYRLELWDCYRPLSVQRYMWKLVPTPGLVANPKHGSNHNRGSAVDCTLVHLDGSKVEMPTDLDSFTPEAHAHATNVPKRARKHRMILQSVMMGLGFTTIRMEWWHFNYMNARHYPIADVPLSPRG